MAKGANNTKRTVKTKKENGEGRNINRKFDDYNLGWFEPSGSQHLIVESIEEKDLTIVDAPSGCGKSTTVMWKALQEYRDRNYDKLILIKNPTEAGDDQIGFLPNSAEDKISVHMEAMKTIFYQFVSKQKLDNDCRSDNIVLTIPNFCLGVTFDNSFIIIEEAQTMSPNTIKLLTERTGMNSKVVVVGDSKQRYSAKKREDGFKDFIDRVTEDGSGISKSKIDSFGYVRLESDNNRRSETSRIITELYDD